MNDWPEDANVDGPIPPPNGKGFGIGDTCPDCNTLLEYDEGEEQTFDHPGMPDGMWCDECGVRFPVDWDRMPNEEADWYEELNRGYNQDRI